MKLIIKEWERKEKMDTKSMIIDIATALFQQKGYKGVGLNEILNVCKITKGSLYHHFPNGKEELLIACLQSMKESISTDIADTCNRFPTAIEALKGIIEKLIADFDREGTISGHTFNSMVSEMGTITESVRNECSALYIKLQGIFANKLSADGFSKERVDSLALMIVASMEGAMMLCLTQKSNKPLKTIMHLLPNLLKKIG